MSASTKPSGIGAGKQVAEIKPSERFVSRCRELADEFVASKRYRLARIVPLTIVVFAVISAFSLVYVQLPWFFFGPSVAAGFLFVSLTVGDELEDGGPVRKRLQSWITCWPWWEYLAFGLLAATFLIAAIWGGFWSSVVMGGACGVALAMIFYIAVTLPLKESRTAIHQGYSQVVKTLQRFGLSDLEIENGTPKLLGTQWMPLFEQVFGYEAYRSVSQLVKENEPDLMSRQRRVRDWTCDFLSYGIHHKTGPLATLAAFRQKQLNAAADKQVMREMPVARHAGEMEFATPLVSQSEHRVGGELIQAEIVDSDPFFDSGPAFPTGGQSRPVRVDPSHVAASGVDVSGVDVTVQSLGALDPSNLNFYVTNDQLDRLLGEEQLQKAGSPRHIGTDLDNQARLSPEQKKKMHRLDRFLGDEARLTLAFLAMGVFGFWVFHSRLASEASVEQIKTAFSEIHLESSEAIRRSVNQIAESLTMCEQAIVPLGISGWSMLIVAVVLFLSSIKHGWQYSLFVIPACLVLIGGMSATLVHHSSRELAWVSVAMCLTILVLGLLWDQTALGKRYAIFNVRR